MTYYVGSNNSGSYPYSTVVYITATFPNGKSFTGSGVVVGQNDVLTASHVVNSVANGGAATSVVVYPGRDGGYSPYGSYSAERWNYYQIDNDGDGLLSQSDSQYDVAILSFDEKIGDATGWMGIDPTNERGYFNLTGFPGTYADYTGPRMTNDYGSASENSFYDVLDYGSLESNPGNSGGPIWYQTGGSYYVSGIVSTGGWGAGLDLTYDQIVSWMNDNNYMIAGGGGGTGSGADRVTGTAGQDTYYGWGGSDTIYGGAGNDFLQGNQESDDLYGESGNDTLRGGQGNDHLFGGDGGDSLYGDIGNDYVDAGNGDDFINGGRISSYAGNDNDTLLGGGGNDFIQGNLGEDDVHGDDGDDTLRGGQGNDSIWGGAGADFLYGDRGDDSLIGGDGIDAAIYNGQSSGFSFSQVNGVWIVTDNQGLLGQDTLSGIEFIVFDDGIFPI